MKQPMTFTATAESNCGINTLWQVQSQNYNLTCAIPPEFNGPGGGFSPEDLYIQALMNCFIGTFKVYAENSKLTFEKLNVQTELTVDTNEFKKTIMKKCHFIISLDKPTNQEKADLLIKKVFQSGFILNSVKTEITFDVQYIS